MTQLTLTAAISGNPTSIYETPLQDIMNFFTNTGWRLAGQIAARMFADNLQHVLTDGTNVIFLARLWTHGGIETTFVCEVGPVWHDHYLDPIPEWLEAPFPPMSPPPGFVNTPQG